jgi:hypothetical protein
MVRYRVRALALIILLVISSSGPSKREDEERESAPLEFVADFQILRILLYQLIDYVSNSRCIQKMTPQHDSARYHQGDLIIPRNRDLPRTGECGWSSSLSVILTSTLQIHCIIVRKQTALELHANYHIFRYDQINEPYAVPPSAMAQV